MIATLMSVIIFKKENIQQRWTNTLYVQGTLCSLEWGPAVMETDDLGPYRADTILGDGSKL